MKFTLNVNIILTATVILAVAAINIYNQIHTPPGLINVQTLLGELTGPAVLTVLNLLAHTKNPDGTNAAVPYDKTRD